MTTESRPRSDGTDQQIDCINHRAWVKWVREREKVKKGKMNE